MYSKGSVESLLKKVRAKRISLKEACTVLRDLPYKDLGFAKVDKHRLLRRGFPEVVYCKGKTPLQVEKILGSLYDGPNPLLLTSAEEGLYKRLKAVYPKLLYSKIAKMIYVAKLRPKGAKEVLVITAGTADIPVAEQARITLEVMRNRVSVLYDVGVAGIHRLLDNKKRLFKANVIIVVAGMEGALASVVSGLVSRPVIAVPTSVGYGASFKGIAPLLTMLNSCSPGVGVVNIDNGFGAGYLAGVINRGT